MSLLRTSVVAIVCLVGLAACTSSAPSAQAPTASSAAGAGGTPSSSPSPAASAATPSAVAAATTSGPQTLDPCRLLTIQEASQIFGVTLTATQRGSDGISCTYSTGTTSVTITVHQASNAAAAMQGLQDAIAKLKTSGATATALSGIGDAAYETSVTVAGRTIAGIDGVRGTVLFTVGGQPNLADAALRQAALTVVGRL